MSQLDLTVGMLTYNRSNLLERHLKFMSLYPYKFKIIVLDGSTKPESIAQNKALVAKYGAVHLVEKSTIKRMEFFFENVTTQFAAWATDDDLFSPAFYKEGVDFLSLNRRYSVVTGRMMTLYYEKIRGLDSFYLGDALSNPYNIVEGDFLERIIRKDQVYANGCTPTFYGVRTYDNLKLFMKYVGRLDKGSSMERLENITNLLFNGMKCLDEVIMGFRDYTSEPHRDVERDDPETYIPEHDVNVLKEVIETEVGPSIQSNDVLNYILGYAWKLPLRPAQNIKIEPLRNAARKKQLILNRFFYRSNYGLDKKIFGNLKAVLC
jgi:hypothetical protein